MLRYVESIQLIVIIFLIANNYDSANIFTDRYMNPPDKALVLCLDEKSHIQALDRTQRAEFIRVISVRQMTPRERKAYEP